MSDRGRRLGWIGGGIGGLLWLLPVTIVATLQHNSTAAMTAVLLFAAGLSYLWLLAPWKYPATPFALIYLGLIAIIAAAAVALLWLLAPSTLGVMRRLAMLAPLATLLIPALIFGRRCWDELGPALIRRDDDGCR